MKKTAIMIIVLIMIGIALFVFYPKIEKHYMKRKCEIYAQEKALDYIADNNGSRFFIGERLFNYCHNVRNY